MKKYPPTPELDKLKSVSADSQKLGAFLDWLQGQGTPICELVEGERRDDDPAYFPVNKSIEQTLAAYFEIDLNEVENERRAILEHIRANRGVPGF